MAFVSRLRAPAGRKARSVVRSPRRAARPPRGRTRRARHRRSKLWESCRHRRKKDGKLATAADLASNADGPTVLLDDPMRDAQAESSALADVFRGEERLEHACCRRLVHAVTAIDDT